MAATPPKFKINDLVYLKSSAATGVLESYRVSQILQTSASSYWQYKIAIRKKYATSQTVEDVVDLQTEQPFILDEGDLLTGCEAAAIMVANAQKRLTQAQAQQLALCHGAPPPPGPTFWSP
jgi:hypothetical protein